ncbi:MAG: dethiobiotin synthetase [Actinomycetota bacterium]|nr:dethiobiotin synthetase [Actinomycetota bacterium]
MIVVVTGTGTEIGKTWVTAVLAGALRRRGIAIAVRKPVQSFSIDQGVPTDAEILGNASGVGAQTVCPAHRWLPRALAPPMAAEALGFAPFTISELASEVTTNTEPGAIVIVESAGGVRSPLAVDGDTVSLVVALQPALVVLVADAELGTINLVRLSTDALGGHRVVVYLNRFDDHDELHSRNRDWLITREGLEVVTNPEALESIVAAVASR